MIFLFGRYLSYYKLLVFSVYNNQVSTLPISVNFTMTDKFTDIRRITVFFLFLAYARLIFTKNFQLLCFQIRTLFSGCIPCIFFQGFRTLYTYLIYSGIKHGGVLRHKKNEGGEDIIDPIIQDLTVIFLSIVRTFV